MADNIVELPNVDIFDPVMCARRWAKCATQQEINVYLNKQIDINRSVLTDTIKAQNEINAASKTKLDNHETRIAALESEVAKLDKAQSDLNAAFQALQTDNNNFKSNVDLLLNQYQSTINLLQQNIDKISLSNEQLWNEVNNLKSQFDPDKLNAAIAGYDSLLRDTKAYTDAEAAKLKTQIDGVASDLQNVNSTLQQMIQDNNISWTSSFDSYRNQINADLEQQNQRITAFIQNTDNVLQLQRTWLTNEIARVDKRIDSLTDKVASNKADIEAKFKAEQTRVNGELENQRNEYTSFNTSQSQIIESNREQAAADDKALGERIDSTNADVSALQTSDGKQWDTINSILAAQNRINDNMEALHAYIVEQIRLANLSIAANTDYIKRVETAGLERGDQIDVLHQVTGYQYRFDAPAAGTGTFYSLPFGLISLDTAANGNQTNFTLSLKSGYKGFIRSMSNIYGSEQIYTDNTKTPVIVNVANPHIIDMRFISADILAPDSMQIIYNPLTKVTTYLVKFSRDADNMPNSGETPPSAT